MRTIERPVTTSFIVWVLLALTLGIALRYVGLDTRALHHDESLHATYGLYFFVDSTHLFYKYDPMLHGPLLYHLIPWAYHFFGITKESARLVTFFFSLFILIIPLFFRGRLGNRRTVELILLLSLSPSLIYWARFLRHDLLMIAAMSGMIISIAIKHDWKRHLLFWTCFGLSFCIKENSFVHMLLFVVFIIFEKFSTNKFSSETFSQKISSEITRHWFPCLIGIILAGFVFSYFYSAGFKYNAGILDGLYRKSLTYWAQQHHQERISGPFAFNFLMMSWYELPLLFLMIIFYLHQLFFKEIYYKMLIIFSLLLGISTHYLMSHEVIGSFISTWLKIKIPLDSYLFWVFLITGISITFQHIREGRQTMAALGYMFFALLFTYSYLGEKVPWLSMYPIIAGYIYMWLYLRQIIGRWPSAVLLVILQSMNLWLSIQLNHINSGDMHELISQVQTTKSYENFAIELSQKLESTNSSVLALDSNTWPLTWFLYGRPGYVFTKDIDNAANFDHVLVDLPDLQWENQLSPTHTREIIPLRSWWWPDFEKMSFKNYFSYYFTRKGWNAPGEKFIAHYRKRLITEQ